MVFYEDQTIHDIQPKKPKTIMVHNLGGDIPQMNYGRDQPTTLDQMEQPDQIEQDEALHEEQMADDNDDDEMDQ